MIQIAFDIPQKMIEVAQDPSIWETPYNLCFHCPAHTVTCDGPNEQSMPIDRYVEWNEQLAKRKGMTRQDIADESGLPLPTVISIMSGRTTDPRHSTTQAISKAISGGCWGKYPCHIAYMLMTNSYEHTIRHEDYRALTNEISSLRREIEEYRAALADIHNSYGKELADVRADSQRKIDHLLAENKKKDEQISKLIDKLLN